jgi:YggT family protein
MTGYLSNVGALIVAAIFGLLLLVAVLRVVLPLAGARFRNPICQLVYKATNPIVAPLGKILPNVRNVSTAAILVVLVISFAAATILLALLGVPLSPLTIVMVGFGTALQFTLSLYFWSIIVYALMSFLSPDHGNPLVELLTDLTRPVLKPFRKLPPKMSGIDLSPLWACLVLRIVMMTLTYIGFVGLLS